ncbi:MAG: thrombospondin type 3 repeat-containing protein [Flavobacteriaceae bacterium]
MTNKLLLAALFMSAFSYAQYNKSAPWMEELEKRKSATAKSSNQPYTLYEISDSFERYWKGKDPNQKGSGYKPYKRWESYWKYQVDKDGYIPSPQALWNAWKNKSSSSGKVVNPTSDWTSIGPTTHGSLGGRLPGQGRVNAVAVDPNNEDVWYVGAPAGGIWKSTDAGASWTNLFDDFPQIGVSGIAIVPNPNPNLDSNTSYITTGDDDAADSYSVGVFKSTNGGTTWNETGLNPSNANIASLMNEITVDPTDSDIVWVGTNSGLYKSVNGGDTWEVKQGGNIKDFKLKPGDSNTIYAVTNNQFFKSTNGEDFTQITDNLPTSSGRFVLGVSPADANVVYILSANTGANNFSYQGLYRSSDSGETFTESPNTTDIMESNQAWFDLALEVSPTNADELYMGCLNIWKSTNGGDSFIRLNQWFSNNPAYTHADIHTLKFFGDKLFCGSDGGVYVSENGGVSFQDYTVNGIAIGQFYRLSVAKDDASKMAGGLQDNSGFIRNNNSWNVFTGGDGMDYEIDPTNSNIIYGFAQFGDPLFISSNSGQSIGTVNAPSGIQGNWITPLAVSSEGDVYAGYDGVYKLEGSAWQKISDDIGNGNMEDLEVDPTNPMVLYAAEGNIVYRSDDGGQSFTAFNIFDSQISDMAINSTDGSFIYVTTSNRVGTPESQQQNARGVFRVAVNANGNAGPEEDLTLNLPADQSFFSIAHQGRHSNNPIYVGTSLGVYRLDDTLTEWEDYFTNLPSVVISDLEISLDDELITASTYGRGVWQSPIPIQVPDNDVRLLSMTPAADAVLCGEITPQIEVENNGLNTITQVEITYSIAGGANQNMNAAVNLDSGESALIDLPSINIGTIGQSSITVSVSITNDAFADNNSLTNDFFVNAFGFGDAVNTFESASDALVTYNENGNGSVWERGVPSGTLLNQAASGTQVYGTNLDGDHPDGTVGILLSNCYELSNILAPVLKFTMAYDLEINFDIVYVQYSIDSGATWNVLGNINSQPNWYNSDRTNANSGNDDDCQNCPGAQWTGTNATLTEYAYDFVANAALGETDLTNESNVLFRIVFHSDPAVTQEGVIIDDFVVEGFQDDDDDDNDGILDVNDNCPLIGNADQLNTDGDSEGNACDNDDDNDGIIDTEDNCPLVPNADQADADGDGIGDVCDTDADNDGVPNAIDQCPDTPAGAVVDITGCEIFSLPASNFRVQTTGESCISSNNGSIEISATETLNYTAVITGPNIDETSNFTETISFMDLTAGTYEIYITVEGQNDYETCFNTIITEPEPLSVTSKISSLDNEVTLNLSGGKAYTINLNGKRYETRESEITLPLNLVENKLSVKTDLDCQGIYEERIVLSSELLVYPNPIAGGNLNIYLGNLGAEDVEISLFSVNGTRVMAKRYPVHDNQLSISVDGLAKGIYLLNVKTKRSLLNFKIVRK